MESNTECIAILVWSIFDMVGSRFLTVE